MTPEQLAAIKARAGIGTPMTEHDCALQGYGCELCQNEANASAADVPALVEEVERLRAALAKEREACDQYRIGGGPHSWDKRRHDYCHPMPDGRNEWGGADKRCDLCRSVDARRAAEANEPTR